MRSWLNPSFLADLSNIRLIKTSDEWSYFLCEKMVKVESLITINDIEASHIDDDDEKEMRQMGEVLALS